MFADVLTDDESEALAQFCKRIGWTQILQLAANEDEALDMQSALLVVAKQLAEDGFNPR